MIESFKFFKRKEVNLIDIVDIVFYSLIDLMYDGYDIFFFIEIDNNSYKFSYINNKIEFGAPNQLPAKFNYIFNKKDELIVIIRKAGTINFSDIENVILETSDRMKEMGLKLEIHKPIEQYYTRAGTYKKMVDNIVKLKIKR